ncbi:MFS transporter [Rhabdaerophilum sp. SD176]|uniref:MFS transporter n=1 Tax=Rhabdaerophilum sp. SD176 TaxID=2983548 RepID=UPI0024DF957B|nr:MFS transporter [Rhabdaerophilum sp. SD176]
MPVVIFVLATVNIAIGTQSFVFTGLLAELAADLGVSIGAAGQLVPASAITFAVASPFAMSMLARYERKRVILIGLAVLSICNFLCAFAPTFPALLGLRILGGLATACIGSLATASVTAFAPPERRGRAFALVVGGMTVALAVGVPLGSVIGGIFGWHATFVYSGLVCAACTVLIAMGMPRLKPESRSTIPVGAILQSPEVIQVFALTTLAFAAAFTIVAFLGPIIHAVTGLKGAGIGALQAFIGVGSFLGLALGGILGDQERHHLGLILSFVSAAMVALGFAFLLAGPAASWPPALIAVLILISSTALFAAIPINLSRLGTLAGAATPVVLATNGSLVSLGQGLGAILGGFLADNAGLFWVCIGSAAIALGGLVLAVSQPVTMCGPGHSRLGADS